MRCGGLDGNRELPLLAAGIHNSPSPRRRDTLQGDELRTVIPEAHEAPDQRGTDIPALTQPRREPGLDLTDQDGEQPVN